MSAQLIIPPIPALDEERSALLARLTSGLDVAALNWISGYAAGLAARGVPALATLPVATPAVTALRVTVLYGSQTGNAKREAERLHESLCGEAGEVRLVRADAYPMRELAEERVLFIVISTQGEGEPPDDARGFVEFVCGRRAPKLDRLQFAVLGLGDASYPQFNAIGRRLDARLEALGARRLFAHGDADVDVASVAAPWIGRACEHVRALKPASSPVIVADDVATGTALVRWHKEQPYLAELLVNQRISARDSTQEVRHLEIDLADSGLTYVPGDALGIRPRNAAVVVDRVIARLGLSGHESVRIGDEIRSLQDWLGGHRELTRLHRGFVQQHAQRAKAPLLDAMLANDDAMAFNSWLHARQIDDVLNEFPGEWSAGEFVAALRPLLPRLYSIASSRKAVGDEAHLTVAVLDNAGPFGAHRGVASGFLADVEVGASLPIFIESNDRFRLPLDAARDVIMIGPGTGVAPFRGFVQERTAIGASGRNWLIFGARHQRSQFLYQLEWQAALKAGQLQRLDLAFSRDSAEPVYVQQRLIEQGRDVYAWLEAGAHLYVCGATAMGRSVHAALRDIVIEHGGRDAEAADEYLSELQRSGCYARDVY